MTAATSVSEDERSGLRSRVLTVLAGLPEAHRATLVLSDLHGLDHLALARALDCSPGAARVRLHRARNLLRAALGRVGIAGAATVAVLDAGETAPLIAPGLCVRLHGLANASTAPVLSSASVLPVANLPRLLMDLAPGGILIAAGIAAMAGLMKTPSVASTSTKPSAIFAASKASGKPIPAGILMPMGYSAINPPTIVTQVAQSLLAPRSSVPNPEPPGLQFASGLEAAVTASDRPHAQADWGGEILLVPVLTIQWPDPRSEAETSWDWGFPVTMPAELAKALALGTTVDGYRPLDDPADCVCVAVGWRRAVMIPIAYLRPLVARPEATGGTVHFLLSLPPADHAKESANNEYGSRAISVEVSKITDVIQMRCPPSGRN